MVPKTSPIMGKTCVNPHKKVYGHQKDRVIHLGNSDSKLKIMREFLTHLCFEEAWFWFIMCGLFPLLCFILERKLWNNVFILFSSREKHHSFSIFNIFFVFFKKTTKTMDFIQWVKKEYLKVVGALKFDQFFRFWDFQKSLKRASKNFSNNKQNLRKWAKKGVRP